LAGRPRSAEVHPGPGFRIREGVERADPADVAALGEFDTPTISDAMNRLYAMAPEIRRLTDPGLRLAGPACTVKVYPGDNLMVHKALDVAAPGDVLVVDAGRCGAAVLGDLISMKARHRGIAGVVIDGLVRDLERILALGDFPVYARGTTPIGPLHRGPGEINFPVCAGGVVVCPGDAVVADADGVVVVPRDFASELTERLRRRAASDEDYTAAVARGEFSNAWVDDQLASSGLEALEASVESPLRP
jgi:RraA family protein